MKKLSNAQAKFMENAKEKIDYAREHDFIHWLSNMNGYDLDRDWDKVPNPYLTNETVWESAKELAEKADEWWKKAYENEKNGIVLIPCRSRRSERFAYCNSKTLAKLAEYGLIEIIYDSNSQEYGVDKVKVLNY